MILGLVVLVLIILAVVLYFSASQAVVKITSRISTAETDFVAQVVTDGNEVLEGSLNGVLYEIVVSGSKQGESSGSKILELEGDSVGKVVLTNELEQEQTLVQKTRLLSPDGVLVRLSERVSVPAGGTLEAEVYPDDPASFTELAPTKFTIPGLSQDLQKMVYAENKNTLKSEGPSVKVVKASDIALTKDALTEELYDEAIREFTDKLNDKQYTVVVVSKTILDEELSAESGDEADSFEISTELKVVLMAIKQDEVIALAGERLQKVLPQGRELLKLNMEEFSYKVQNYDKNEEKATIRVHVEGATVVSPGNDIFRKEKIMGLSPKGVELYLANYQEVESVEVELSPFWVKKVPKMEDHVIIIVENAPEE